MDEEQIDEEESDEEERLSQPTEDVKEKKMSLIDNVGVHLSGSNVYFVDMLKCPKLKMNSKIINVTEKPATLLLPLLFGATTSPLKILELGFGSLSVLRC